ncbi:ATP-binding protein [Aestuariirhabdus sp. Z084]|uniref:ATP-binding protein n=1 Tax=Aestuariirhabdus haliotis TaxID=2918751 RepID=UPI00201B37DE|nr:ATP-binding protein [Aestuariirhabdus haliotis]MCL6417434.1 ATP-binding protein [Aestuariirhabdus haliotis]MCL6421378.1 ATP-binding protein [Aestuariirhabdus haliotis]
MKSSDRLGNRRLGIGGRLVLAFVLISSITVVASGVATNTYLGLSDRLLSFEQQDVPGLDAAARLNDRSRLIVATAPLLMTSDSALARDKLMQALNRAIDEMDRLMRNLPEYNRYFTELIVQINNSLLLLEQSVERQEQLRRALDLQSRNAFDLSRRLIVLLESLPEPQRSEPVWGIISRLYYYSGMVKTVRNNASFNDLDDSFIRLEQLGDEVRHELVQVPASVITPTMTIQIEELLRMGSRQGPLFRLKNEALDLGYQQSFFLHNSQQHIQQLAAQINQYTNEANGRISQSLNDAIGTINTGIRSILLLSLISLAIAAAISWFYVRRNVLQRILELQHNMRAIASAQLDTRIRIAGDDEISAMARDLKHFQQTAIAVELTNQQLAAEVEERIAAEAQLKSTQNELIQAGKLAALGQLSVGITHEINQPLTAIASHLHTAGRRLDKQQPEQARENMAKIKSLLEKIAGITRHLKAFARAASAERVPVDLNKVIEDSLELMANRINELDCQLVYGKKSPAIRVLGEPIRLEQVLVNLINNALDAMQQCSKKILKIEIEEGFDRVQVRVSDTGVGIPPETIEQIFDPFFTSKEVGQGLGLGLSISYNIVQDFGGKIRVYEVPEGGSCFVLELQRSPDRTHEGSEHLPKSETQSMTGKLPKEVLDAS